MTDVIKNWERKHGMRGSPSLKERISSATYRLRAQGERLNQAYSRMRGHYNELFGKCANAMTAKDTTRATLYANECAQIRRMLQTILRSQFAIEQVALRLETVEELGDFAVDMVPVTGVISSIKGQLSGIVPEISYTLEEIGGALNDLTMEAGAISTVAWSVASSTDAEKILAEANTVAEQKMKERFPELPATPLPGG